MMRCWLWAALLAVFFTAAHAETQPKPACLRAAVGKQTYSLEVAATPKAREHGLMNRDHIGPCDGMAFFFSALAPQKFWMKNTRIPLDMLFVDAKGKVAAIVTAKPYSETPVGPDIPISSVIEIDGGRASRDGIAIGDVVHYTLRPTAKANSK